MSKGRTQHLAHQLATIAVSLLLLCSCKERNQINGNVIEQNDSFTVTGDSIIEGSLWAMAPASRDRINSNITTGRLDSTYHLIKDSLNIRFETGSHWRKRKSWPAMMPLYHSDQALVDALYNMSVEHITDAIDRHGRFAVTSNLSRLYCSIYLSLAALKPHQSMTTLRSLVDRDSIIMQREGQWPVVSDHIGWATAAWEVYKTTGDRDWLNYCYHVVSKTLSINEQVLLDREAGLIHGAGYTSSRPLGPRRMTWMGYNDLFACMSLGNNILTARAYSILADMCDELGIDNSFEKDSQHIKDAINQHLWNEDKGFYSSFLYGMAMMRQSPVTDNTSQAMCVLWGIADDDRAEYLISQTPVSNYGVNVNYPPGNPVEPFLANSSWATTQAMWNLAAAAVANENALRHGLGAMYRAGAFYQSQGMHVSGINTDVLGTGASNAAMILRVLMGMNFKPEGIEFLPMVPRGMGGTKTLKDFNYRKAVINITIHGHGNEVETITDDGKPLEGAFLPKDIQGRHNIVITLREAGRGTQRVTIHHGEVIMPPAPTVVWTGDSGYIVDYNPECHYFLSANGKLSNLNDSAFAIPNVTEFTEFSVEIAGKYMNGFISQPYINLSLTPQIVFFNDTATDSTTVKVSVSRGGDYLLDVGYKPTGTLDVRRVIANSHPMGTLVMSASSRQATEQAAYSNMVHIKLLKGENVITIKQIRLPKSFTPCQPVHMRIIQL